MNLLKGSFVALVLALASCSPRHGLAERGAHHATARTENATSVSRDSVIIAEKVRYVKINDTIFRDSIFIVTKIKTKIDTILRVDSVHISDTIRVITFRDPRTFIEKTTDKIGNACILLVVIVIIVQLLKINKK